MKTSRNPLVCLLGTVLFVGVLLALAGLAQPLVAWRGTHGQNPVAQLTARDAVGDAWERARQSGRYHFTADVVQRTVPVLSGSSAGQRSEEERMHMEGDSDLGQRKLTFTMWGQGGNVSDASSGVQVEIEGDQARARHADQAWQEINDFSGLFSQGGDLMAFLSAAKGIEEDGTETRGGVTFTRYRFQVDGPGYAAFLRNEMQKQLAEQGELPPGVQLGLPEQFVGMTGGGELWVSADGLPIRQITHLRFAAEQGSDHQIEADITSDFSDYGPVVGGPSLPLVGLQLPILSQFLPTVGQLQGAAMLLVLLALAVLLVRHRQSRRVYAAVAIVTIISTVASPFASSTQAAGFGARQDVKAEEQRARQEESDLQRTARSLGTETAFEPHTDPVLAAEQSEALQQVFADGAPADGAEAGLAALAVGDVPNDQGDADSDGLSNLVENRLGTSGTLADSDNDLVPDGVEVRGFEFPAGSGTWWYADPLELDSNRDGIDDGREWRYDPAQASRIVDTDSDGAPDTFDHDNDGDGVPDRQDLSPTQQAGIFSESRPFSLKVERLAANQPTFVEFQIRPTNPERLWFAFNVLDWPQDRRGQIQDGDNATFYSAANGANVPQLPNAHGDMRVVPMLEIQTTGAPSNLPLTTPRSPQLFIDDQQGSGYKGIIVLSQRGGNVNARWQDAIWSTPDSQHLAIYQGSCDTLQGAGTQVRSVDIPNATPTGSVDLPSVDLRAIGGGQHSVVMWTGTAPPTSAVKFGCANIPPLLYEGNQTVDYEKLSQYGISVKRLEPNDATRWGIYVPLQMVSDEQQTRVAWAGNMLYQPTGGWNAQSVRMVWFVQMLVDTCESYRDTKGVTHADCQTYARVNQTQVVQSYYDEWTLTGLNVRESRGTEQAIVYEDPAVDSRVQEEDTLFGLATALESSFLTGRDDNKNNKRDVTVQASSGDASLAARLDRRNNPSDAQRWGLPNILRVETRSYPHLDLALAGATMTETKQVLSAFTSHWSASAPITPTLMIAREERVRTINLESLVRTGGYAAWNDTRTTLTLSLNPSGTQAGEEPVYTLATLNMAPYCYNGSEWRACEMTRYWDELSQRYASTAGNPGDSVDVTRGKLTMIQLYYLALYQGVTQPVAVGTSLVGAPDAVRTDDAIQRTISTALGGVGTGTRIAVSKLINEIVIPLQIQSLRLHDYLGKVAQGSTETLGTFTSATWQTAGKFLSSYKNLFTSGKALKGVGIGVALGAIVAVAVSAGVGLVVGWLKGGELGQRIAGSIAAGLVGAILIFLQIVLPLITVVKVVSHLIRTGVGGLTAVYRVMTASTTLIGSTLKASVVGLVLQLVFAFGLFLFEFIWSAAAGVLTVDSALQMINNFVAGAIVAILLFVLGLKIIGALIIALVGVVDLILLVLCQAAKVESACFSIIGSLTKEIAKLGAETSTTIDLQQPNLIVPGVPTVRLGTPSAGYRAGNTLEFSMPMQTNLRMEERFAGTAGSGGSASGPLTGNALKYVQEALRLATFRYQLNSAPTFRETVQVGQMQNEWTLFPDRYPGFLKFLFSATKSQQLAAPVPLQAGLNWQPPLYLHTAYAVEKTVCALGSCGTGFTDEQVTGHNSYAIGSNFIFDVFPATFGQFYTLQGSEAGTALGWSPEFLTMQDADGDGLRARVAQGNDPNDIRWDSDGDGLSDRYELDPTADWDGRALSATSNDTDGDGLLDGDEPRRGTDPTRADSDSDGLSDRQEVIGWNVQIGGGSYHVFSDPQSADADGDGLNDGIEKGFASQGYSPNVWNESPFAVYADSSDRDRIVAPGQSFVYTTTVQNTLGGSLWRNGVAQVTLPASLGGAVLSQPIGVASQTRTGYESTQGTSVTVPGGAPTGPAPIRGAVSVQLAPTGPAWLVSQNATSAPRASADPLTAANSAPLPNIGFGNQYVTVAQQGTNANGRATLYASTGDSYLLPTQDNPFTATPDVACTHDGKCLVIMNQQGFVENRPYLYGVLVKVEPDPARLGNVTFRLLNQSIFIGRDSTGQVILPSQHGAVASDGRSFMVVFQGNGKDIYATSVAEDGNPSGPFRVSASNDLHNMTPDITWGGQYWAAWTTLHEGPPNVRSQLSGSRVDESVQNGAGTVILEGNPYAYSNFRNPRIAYDPGQQQAYVLWQYRVSESRSAIVGRAWNTATGALGALELHADYTEDARDPQENPQVAFNPVSRNWLVGWSRSGQFHTRAGTGMGFDSTNTLAFQSAARSNGVALSCPAPAAAPTLRYGFEEARPQTLFDLSGYEHQGTCAGGNCPQALQGGVPADPRGDFAFTFDGQNDRIEVAKTPAIQWPEGTISAWFKADPDVSNYRVLLADEGSGASHPIRWSYRLMIMQGSGILRFDFTKHPDSNPNAAPTAEIVNTGVAVNDGRWHHVAVVRANGTVRVYLDGVSRVEQSFEQQPDVNNNPLWIGGSPYNGGSYPFKGQIDEVRFYPLPLSDDGIRALLNFQQPETCFAGGPGDDRMNFNQLTIRQNLPDGLITGQDTLNFMVDSDLPSSSISSLRDGDRIRLAANDRIGMSGTAADTTSGVANVAVSVDGGAWQPAQGLGNWSFLLGLAGEGQHTLRSRATDVAGNVQSQPSSITLVVDNTPPVVARLGGNTGQVARVGSTGRWVVSLQGTASDPNGGSVKMVEVQLPSTTPGAEGGTWQRATVQNGAWSLLYELPSNVTDPTGAYAVHARATDGSANLSTPADIGSVAIEVTPPNAEIGFDPAPEDGTLWLPLNERAGATSFADGSGNARGATCSGASCPTAGDAGRVGSGLTFDGSDDFVQLGGASELGLIRSDFTVAAWIRGDVFEAGRDHSIIGTDENVLNRGLHLVVRDRKPYLGFGGNDLGGNTQLQPGQWYHLVWRYDQATGEQAIYINGRRDASRLGAAPFEGTGIVRLGRWLGGTHFDGTIDDLRIFNRALSQGEIESLGLTQPAATTLHLPLNEPADARSFVDGSGNGRTASCSGSTCPTPGEPGRWGNALAFDGTDDYLELAVDIPENNAALSLWFRSDCPNCALFQASAGLRGENGYDRTLYLRGGDLCARVWNNETICTTGATYSNNAWHHVVYQYGSTIGGQRLLVDGAERARGSKATSDFNWQSAITIGYTGDAQGYFRGQMDDLRVFDRTLSQTEVEALNLQTLPARITSAQTVRGRATDPGPAASGVAGVEVALVPAALADLQGRAAVNLPFNELAGMGWFEDVTGRGNGVGCTGDRCPTAGVAGRLGRALSFDGSNDVLEMTLDVPETAAAVSFWFRTDCWWCGLLSMDAGERGAGGNDRHIYLAEGNVCARIYEHEIICTSGSYHEGTLLADNRWHHLVYRYGGTQGGQSLSIDGVERARGSKPDSNFTWQTGINIGLANDAGLPYFKGQLDEVQIWDRSISAFDILTLYQAAETSWQPATLTQSGAPATTWSLNLPEADGFYGLQLRTTDGAGNQRVSPEAWRGEYDTRAPRIATTRSRRWAYEWVQSPYFYWGYPEWRIYERFNVTFTDYWLDEATLQLPSVPAPHTCNWTTERLYDDSEWWKTAFPGTPRLVQIRATCETVWWPIEYDPIRVCDRFGHCTQQPLGQGATTLSDERGPGGEEPPAPLATTMLTPTMGIVLTSTAPLTVTGAVYAQDSVRDIQVTLAGEPFHSEQWAEQDGITVTAWSAPWTPTEGEWLFQTTLRDWADREITESFTVTVDSAAPVLTLGTTVLTSTQQVGEAEIELSGLVTDTGQLDGVQAQVVGSGEANWFDATVDGDDWRAAMTFPSLADGETFTVTVRAMDVASRTTQITDTVWVDVQPPSVVEISLAYVDDEGMAHAVESGETVTASTNLLLRWTASADGSDVASYLVGLSPNAETNLDALTPYAPGDARTLAYEAAEPTALYAHVVTMDGLGNQQAQVTGPFYVDLPATPDLIGDLAYQGWKGNQCSLIGTSQAVLRNAAESSSLSDLQQLYASWDAEALRLAWSGANWDVDGDLFIYLDTGVPGGATEAYNPYPATADNTRIYLPGTSSQQALNAQQSRATQGDAGPDLLGRRRERAFVQAGPNRAAAGEGSQMMADYLVWVKDNATVVLLRWNSTAWTEAATFAMGDLAGDGLRGRVDASPDAPTTDLYLPFDALGLSQPASTPVKLLALATEEAALRLWTAMPSTNPLNSEQVVNTIGVVEQQTFALTHNYSWGGLALGLCPNQDQRTEAELEVTITADPAGVMYNFDELFWLWEALFNSTGTALPEDAFDFLDTNYPVIGDRQVVNYTVHYRNGGALLVPGVTVDVAAWNVLRLPEGERIEEPDGYSWDNLILELGDVAPGEEGTLTFVGEVDVEATRPQVDQCVEAYGEEEYDICFEMLQWASIDAIVADALSDPFMGDTPLDWIWVDHAVDILEPYLVIEEPNDSIKPGPQTARGYVWDESPLTELSLQVQGPGGGPATIDCLVPAAGATEWSCRWNAPNTTNGATYQLRVRGTDQMGLTSEWSEWYSVVVDTVAPTVQVDELTRTVDGAQVSQPQLQFGGTATDARGITSVQICETTDGAERCTDASVVARVDESQAVAYNDAPQAETPIPSSNSCEGDELVRTFTVADTFAVGDVNLGFSADHPYRGDLYAWLKSPSGTEVIVIFDDTDQYGSAQNFDVLLNDEALGALPGPSDDDTAAPYFDRQARPYRPLAAFQGEPAQGEWSLHLCDYYSDEDSGSYNRSRLLLTPSGSAPAAWDWSYTQANEAGSDGEPQQLTLYGVDRAGNRSSAPETLQYTVDNVAPAITVTTHLPGVEPDATTPVLEGLVTDGGGLNEVRVRLLQPDGTFASTLAERDGDTWYYAFTNPELGDYLLWVEATDEAGNRQEIGSYAVQVNSPTAVEVTLLQVGERGTLPLGLVALAALVLLAGGLSIRRRRWF